MITREENPFEDKKVANEWIRSIEGEKGLIRDKEIYPMLEVWASNVESGVLLEIGSGQGICSQHLGRFVGEYFGVEPSTVLTERAKQIYMTNKSNHFVIGNAYELPLKDDSVDAVFSINVWFHLENLQSAAQELSRVLKVGKPFKIISANPNSYKSWRGFFFDGEQKGKLVSGKIHVPVNPLSRNDIYFHTLDEIIESLECANLQITSKVEFGSFSDNSLFISIDGIKKS